MLRALAGVTVAMPAWGNPTTCATLCGGADPCAVTTTVTVTPGSVIDCGSRTVDVNGGMLVVHDGMFVLRGGAVRVRGAGQLLADCPAGTKAQGFAIDATGDVTVESPGGAKLRASCTTAGGDIGISAGGNVTVAGNGIRADGTASGAPGGSIRITAGGNVTTSFDVSATTTGAAPGGVVTVIADGTASIQAPVSVQGHATEGGSLTIQSWGDLTVGGQVWADVADTGDGGTIVLDGANVTVTAQLSAKGIGSGSNGGQIDVTARGRVDLRKDLLAKSGSTGGSITVSGRGPVSIGASGAANLELTVSGASGGAGGALRIASEADDVQVWGQLTATDGISGGTAGNITVEAATVTATSSSKIIGDTNAAGTGGSITIVGRDHTTLNGTLHANNGSATFVYRTTPPSVGSGVSGPWQSVQDAALAPPCGDGMLRTTEQCDQLNLGDDVNGVPQTCQSLGFGGGALACTPSCTFDTSGCTP